MPALLPAHGGQYVGPPDVVPPPTGGGGSTGRPAGPTTGQPAGPKAPAPSGPMTPGGAPGTTGGRPAPGASPQPGQTGRGGYELTTDLTQWDIWWEMNKNPYLRLREAVLTGSVQTGDDNWWLGHGRRDGAQDLLKPTQEQIQDEILPALKKAMDSTSQRDITSSCMVAMAKIGQNHSTFRLVDVFAPRLRENDQEVRETAALALGIAGIAEQDEMDLLLGLANDDDAGQRASGPAVARSTTVLGPSRSTAWGWSATTRPTRRSSARPTPRCTECSRTTTSATGTSRSPRSSACRCSTSTPR